MGMKLAMSVLVLMTLPMPVLAAEAEPATGWAQEFDEPIQGAAWDEGKRLLEAAGCELVAPDGSLRIRGQSPARPSVYFPVAGGYQAEPGQYAQWPTVDFREYPMFEIRAQIVQGEDVLFSIGVGFETLGGEHSVAEVGVTRSRQEGHGWVTISTRIPVDIAKPTRSTPVRLTGCEVYPQFPAGSPFEIEIDYMRFRQMTSEEESRFVDMDACIRDYRVPDTRFPDGFFPFGFWVFNYFDIHLMGGEEALLMDLARRHFNSVTCGGPSMWGIAGPDAAEGMVQAARMWARDATAYLDRCHSAGMMSGLNPRGLGSRVAQGGYPREAIRQAVRQAIQAVKDHSALLCYHLYDEPSADAFWEVLSAKSLIEEVDSVHPVLWVLNNLGTGRTYADYSTIQYWDCYPIMKAPGGQNQRSPWSVANKTRQWRELLPDRPSWPLLQSFGVDTPWNPEAESCQMPTPAEA